MLKFLERNKDITNLSNFKTKAISKYYFEINNLSDLEKLEHIIVLSKNNNIKILFIGGGTNVLFAFDIYDGIVIKNNLLGWNYNKETKILETYSNESISDLSNLLKKDFGQNILERFIGLPGTVGGAVYGNAGCFGLEVSNNFLEVKVFNLDTFKIEVFSKEKMNFSYRSSILKEKKNYFIINVKFDLSKKVEKYSLGEIDVYDFRENKQPKGNTCGSFFKNCSKEQSAGYLIEKIGFKGYNLNGALFSKLHSNFLMNDGTASYKDLLKLISLTQEKVKSQFGINLIPEVNIIYN